MNHMVVLREQSHLTHWFPLYQSTTNLYNSQYNWHFSCWNHLTSSLNDPAICANHCLRLLVTTHPYSGTIIWDFYGLSQDWQSLCYLKGKLKLRNQDKFLKSFWWHRPDRYIVCHLCLNDKCSSPFWHHFYEYSNTFLYIWEGSRSTPGNLEKTWKPHSCLCAQKT
jgi:hypothetical protein